MLISTEELAANLGSPEVLIFDCRHDLMKPEVGRELYAAGHIPGAHFAHVDNDLSGPKTGRNGRHPLPDPAAFAAYLGSRGVTPSSQLVAYDQIGGQYAARFWWLCRWIGLDRVRVLDGGWPKWCEEGRASSTGRPRLTPTQVPVNLRPELLVRVDEVLAMTDGALGQVMDARAPARYRGETEPIDPVAGHIPGAGNLFFQTNLQDDFCFKPAAELRRCWEAALAGTEPGAVVHSCGSGITACANLLAMECAGLTGSRLYAGSWSEWCCDPARPVAKGNA